MNIKEDLLKDAQKVLKDKAVLKTYGIQEIVLKDVVRKYPYHNEYAEVDLKVKLLNLFYSTGIQAINTMVNHIMDISKNSNIDIRLRNGDTSLVSEIAKLQISNGKKRINYSFATKYCALHQPDKFPIYDSIVANVLLLLLKKGEIPPYTLRNRKQTGTKTCKYVREYERALRNYDYFVEVYKAFQQAYNLTSFSFRDVDSYIWGAFKLGGQKYRIEQIAPINPKLCQEYKQA